MNPGNVEDKDEYLISKYLLEKFISSKSVLDAVEGNTFLIGKIGQIPAFFENVIPRPVASLMPSGSSTLKRVKCRIRISVNFNLQSSI
jgi:hypothetical protein